MATEPFSIVHGAGLTVFFYFLNALTDEVFDFNDDSWKVNLAGCVAPKLSATESGDLQDADESVYIASTDLSNMNATSASMFILVQGWDDLATDAIIGTEEMIVANGLRVDGGESLPSGAIDSNSFAAGAIDAAAIADAAIDNATFAADVGSTVYATNIMALAADKALVQQRLDHLVAVADADDVVNDAILAKMAATAGDWSTFVETTDSLQSIRDVAPHGSVMVGTNGASTHTPANVTTNLLANTPTAGGVATIQDIFIMLYSMAQGRIVRAGDVYTFYDDDDATVLATLTIAAAARTN